MGMAEWSWTWGRWFLFLLVKFLLVFSVFLGIKISVQAFGFSSIATFMTQPCV